MATKYVNEVLKEINDDISLFETTYKKNGDGGPLGVIFKHAFMAEHKFLLPEGEPPYRATSEPQGMTPANFIQEVRKFYVFTSTNVSASRRETLFIQMLEGIHPIEAKILIAIKDQKLTDLYPNITREAVANAGFIPQATLEQVKAEEAEVKK